MAEPTLDELETKQRELEEILAFFKALIGLGNDIDARLFGRFMRDFQAAGETLDPKIARDIRRELGRRNRAQQRMLPLIIAAAQADLRIADLKAQIEREQNEAAKKRLHKRKIAALLVLVLIHAFIAAFTKYLLDETERLRRKLFI